MSTEEPAKPPYRTWLAPAFLIVGAVVAAGSYWLISDYRQRAAVEHQSTLDLEGNQSLATACALVQARDPYWQLNDLHKRLPKVSPEQDAARLFQQAYEEWNRQQEELRKRDLYVRTFENVLGKYSHELGPPDPSNRLLPTEVVDDLKITVKIFQKCQESVVNAASLTQGNFTALNAGDVAMALRRRGRTASKFFGLDWLLADPNAPPSGRITVTPLCDQAVVDMTEGKPEAWKHLSLALQAAVVPNYAGYQSMRFHSHGCGTCFVVLEWFLGQRVFTAEPLDQLQKQLAPMLKLTTPLKNAVVFQRAMAPFFAEAFRSRQSRIDLDFRETALPPFHVVDRSTATYIRFTTETLDRLDLPLAEFHSWFASEVRRYPWDNTYNGPEELATMTPEQFFRVYFLNYLETTVRIYLYHQERLRVALAALACERYRLRTNQFPVNVDQLHDVLDKELWTELFDKNSPIKINLVPTKFGILVTPLDGVTLPSESDDWERQISMRLLAGQQNTYLGFRLYRPELRGQKP